MFLSFDVGGTKTKYSLVNESGEILESGSFSTKDNKEIIFSNVKNIVEEFKNKNYSIDGLAFSMPGVIDVKNGHMITGGALRDLYDFPFKEKLEQYIGIPVELENDVNCVALAEKWQGNAKDCENFVCLTVGTGVGGAIYIDGKMVRGTKYAAGEFGFMITDRRENYEEASLSMSGSVRGGLIQTYARKKGINWEELNGEKIFELAENGDKIALEVIDDFYTSLAYSVYNLSVSLNPEKILIGGEITRREDFIKIIEDKVEIIKKDVCPLKMPIIERCKFLNDSGKIGAVYHFILNNKNREN
ncbi:ROK family protein [Fusobacterium sp.]|uniref:ROK family protein n=1 Tax=Fusobacterium sp. TaxID=68766 RepID=UPI0015A5540F|nr:ROK family protein [Fusobacterium sp.]MDY2980959.1 ROK family protein [Fusobacterium sp.]